jgi:ribosomal protein S18 acetylase RimI-like enzyme
VTTVDVLAADGRPWDDVLDAVRAGPPGRPSTIAAVVVAGGEEVGRGWARLDTDGGGAAGRTITTWAPRLGPGLARSVRAAVMDAFARWAVDVAGRLWAATVETKPADDVAHLDDWLPALARAGFVEVAVARLMARDLPVDGAGGRDDRPPPGTVLAEVDGLGADERAALEALVGTVHRTSADRVDALDSRSGRDVLAGLAGNRVAAPAPGLWLAAFAGGRPAGYVLGSVDDDGAVWVVDVGVDPALRRNGVGRWLLTSMLGRAGTARRACALVDDVNVASRRLHAAVGFAEEPGAWRTWRAPLDKDYGMRRDSRRARGSDWGNRT